MNIEYCREFEQTHTVLYVENFHQLQKEFILTAVKESQEKAVSNILKKYKKR